MGDVRLDFLQVQDPLLPGGVLVDGSRVDVVEGDPVQDVLRRVVDGHDHDGHAPDDPEEGVSQAAGRQAITQSGLAAAIRSSTTAQSFR